MFIGCFNKSVILTYIGVIIAILGIANSSNNKIAITCLIISGICDLFDGAVARACKNRTEIQKQFGIQIDSLADVIISLALPSAIVLGIKHESLSHQILSMIIIAFYVICGVDRLAYFNINGTEEDNGSKYYRGLPVTYIALIMPIIYIVFHNKSYYELVLFMEMALTGMLFILNIKVTKPTGVWYIIFSILAISCIVSIVLL